MFSKTCTNAIKMMIFISARQCDLCTNYLGLEEIATVTRSPRSFTAKILQQLVKAGLLESTRGRTGGFRIPEPNEITLADVVMAIDGQKLMTGCVLGFKVCSSANPCPIHTKVENLRAFLAKTLDDTSLSHLRQLIGQEQMEEADITQHVHY
ncbi:MAG: Rrf2 family transcriptional regulator [Bacteroidetes bacterium]|jgi:Rrf2 family protein|nr:Rrf2 family transcriptional regulator [Bacteroidota bacterium]